MFKKRQNRRNKQNRATQGSSNRTFSYYTSSVQSPHPLPRYGRSSEQRTTTPSVEKKSRKHVYLNSFIVIFIGIVTVYMSYIDTGNVKFIQTGDTSLLRNSGTYESSLRDIMSRSILYKNKLTIDTGTISTLLKEMHPEISTVRLSFNAIGSRPIVHISGKSPKLALDVGDAEKYYILDTSGRVVAIVSKSIAEQQDIPFILDRSGVEVIVGKPYLASDEVNFILRIRAQAEATKTQIESIMLPPLAREMHVRFSSNPLIYVKFFTGGDADLQFGTYLSVQSSLTTDNNKLNEYIDVRVGERAYLK